MIDFYSHFEWKKFIFTSAASTFGGELNKDVENTFLEFFFHNFMKKRKKSTKNGRKNHFFGPKVSNLW